MKFIVDRTKWYRGHNEGSKLLRTDGFRCCIGFVGQQCEIPDSQLLGRDDIEHNKTEIENWPKWMRVLTRGTLKLQDIAIAYRTNDNPDISESEREDTLKNIFARNGDEIIFVG